MSTFSTHVLDTMKGIPAAGMTVTLELQTRDGGWKKLAEGTTNQEGRISDFLKGEVRLEKGVYRLIFDTAGYYRLTGVAGFYPLIPIYFEIQNPTQHYHVPLLLSPYGYSTYRGS